MKKPADIDGYIAAFPEEIRILLKKRFVRHLEKPSELLKLSVTGFLL
ncbi:MAG: hypothetical protein IPM38_05830 [Ignavibacteria bacterium]|nr:hypothetical protein [Ignavibacteria bacterium]